MVYIGSVGLGIPENEMKQEEVKELIAGDLFTTNRKTKRLLPVFDNALVNTRQLVVDKAWFMDDHDFGETNDIYMKHAIQLSLKAMDHCLAGLHEDGLSYEAIDMIVFVSSTGIATPSLDTHLLNERPFREDIVRMPLWGLGCAGGAIGLSRGFEWIQLHPTKTALIVCCELCSLTFQKKDVSTSNIVGTALFGDGVGATLLIGNESPFTQLLPENRLAIKATNSFTKKGTTKVMGWNITNTGFEVIFSKRIPKLIPTIWKQHLHTFLKKQKIEKEDLTAIIAHPGGRKVLEEMQAALDINEDKLIHSYQVLEEHGNMSSATVVYVLKKWLETGRKENFHQALGLLSALGPGFSSELLLLEWMNR